MKKTLSSAQLLFGCRTQRTWDMLEKKERKLDPGAGGFPHTNPVDSRKGPISIYGSAIQASGANLSSHPK